MIPGMSYADLVWKRGTHKDLSDLLKKVDNIDKMVRIAESVRKAEPVFFEFNMDSPLNLVFVVPTANHEGNHSKRFRNSINNVPVIFAESSGPGFNYSHSCNRAIQKALNYGFNWIVISNDDVIFNQNVEDMVNIVQSSKPDSVYTPVNGKDGRAYYHGEKFSVFRSNPLLLLLEIYNLKFSNKGASIDPSTLGFYLRLLPRMFRTEKFQISVNEGIYIWRKFGKEVVSNLVNFADFGIFPSSVLKQYEFDEVYFNGKEDYDLVIRLHKHGIDVKTIDFDVSSIGSGTFSNVNPSITKEALNNLYFGAKMESFLE